jgi:Flp pilus assembly protein TadB
VTGVVAAALMALAAFLWATRDALPAWTWRRREGRARERRAGGKAEWNVTVRSCRILGIPPSRLRLYSALSAVAVAGLWALLVENLAAGLVMAAVGWQLPGMWVEMRASGTLDQLQRQVSTFVSAVNDALHGRSATAEEAMATACQAVASGPLKPAADQFLRRTEAGVPFPERLSLFADEVDMPGVSFFADLMTLRDATGVERMARAFDLLDEKFREDERLVAQIRGEFLVYSGILVLAAGFNLVVYPGYRVLDPSAWPLIAGHLGVLEFGNAVGSAVVLTGVRRFLRARVNAD